MRDSFFAPKFASKCTTCHGAGILPGKCKNNELVPCPTCHAQGVIEHQISDIIREEIPCNNPNCENGKIAYTQTVDGHPVVKYRVCPVCDGYGVFYNQTETISTSHEKCPTCQGKAFVEAEELRNQNLEVLCPDCSGKGFVFEKKPLKRMAVFAALTFFQPGIAILTGFFGFMLYSVKATLSKK